MDWFDDGYILSAKKHGESSAIVTLLTRDHGRHSGLVRGGNSKQKRAILQPGNLVAAKWHARIADQLGSYTCELKHSCGSDLLGNPLGLAGLSALAAVTEVVLPEKQIYPALYDAFEVLINAFSQTTWPTVYVKWELGLLSELGFALDLSQCAETGVVEDLTHVSPRTGRAVCREVAAPYIDKLLPLPGFLLQSGRLGPPNEIIQALALTGYFLNRHAAAHLKNGLPPARQRLIERLGKTSVSG